MTRDVLQSILEYLKKEEVSKAKKEIEKALLHKSRVSWNNRFKKVHEINKTILNLKLEHQWFLKSLGLLPEERILLVKLQLRKVEQEFYLKPLNTLKMEKKQISRMKGFGA